MEPGPPSHSPPLASASHALEKRSLLWSFVGLGMLLTVGLIAAYTLRQVDESDFWVDHTREVISANQQLLSHVTDAQSAERGYIITGDEGYLEQYQSASLHIPQSAETVRQLVADNPGQQKRVKSLQSLIEERLVVLNDALRQRRELGFDAARAVVLAGQSRAEMKQIQDASQEIEAEENRLLQERTHTRQVRLRDGFVATLAAAVVALVAFIFAPIDVRRAVRQRNVAQQDKEQSAATARALFQAAAQAIFVVDQSGRIVMANPATEKMLGYAESELIGQSVELLVPESLRSGHISHRTGYFRHPQTRPMGFGFDLQARKKDGSVIDVEIGLSYIQSAAGTLAVAFLSDISKRKADEHAIRQQREDLRLLAGRLMTAQDDERRRIARDLHDDLSQKLAYLAMDIGKVATKPSSQEFLDDLRVMQRRAADAAESVRHISHQLHPSILDDIGLDAALEQYCEEFEERSGIRTRFSSRNIPDPLPPEVASSMYHIFQESLRNVSKHSEAEEVFVTLEFVDGVLRLAVKDQGVGLPAGLKTGTGIGIVGMRERAHLVNGTVSIESQVGEGTEVTVAVPLTSVG